MEKRQGVIILVTLVLVLLIINYPYLDTSLEKALSQNEKVFVDRVIDGDTIESNGTSIRLIGINSPERGEYFYSEAKEYLENLIFNETVTLEFVGEREDKYYRILAYVFYQGENINVKLVENGFANYYFYSREDKYSDTLLEAWETCIANEMNLCEPSQDECASCISLTQENVVNSCSFQCDLNGWVVKSEGRDKVVLNSTLASGKALGFELDTSDTSGSLFLRDDGGKLVVYIGGE